MRLHLPVIRTLTSSAAAVAGFILSALQAQPSTAQNVLTPAATTTAPADPAPVNFDDWFVNKALRIEIFQIGDNKEEFVTLDNIYSEPIWPENPRNIIPPFDACRYDVRVFDAASGKVIFVHGFDGLFGEYRTTDPAIKGVKGVYPKAIRIPEPKAPVKVVIENRDKRLALQPLFTFNIDPKDIHIIRANNSMGDFTFEQQKTGDPHDKVDLAFLAEGYTAAEKDKFKADVAKFSDALFSYEPYKSNKDRFNIYGVFRASAESGVSYPTQREYKNTALGASYNTFDTDRYMTIKDDFAIARMAGQVPYDTIAALVNSRRYGGGGITFDLCTISVGDTTAPRIFVHEFGHSFAALADEYVGGVAYNDMFPEGIEPLEANITRLLDPQNIKWKQYVAPGTPLPTPPAARGSRVVGAYEGAGYIASGMYRAQPNCIMGTALPPPNDEFCVACKWGIQRMINYYSPTPAPAGTSQPAPH